MKKYYVFLLFLISFNLFSQTNVGVNGSVGGVYFNEIHYDNIGSDVGEFIEIAGPSGTDLSAYKVTLYNGSAPSLLAYYTVALNGTIDDEGAGIGAVLVPINGSIQNGDPDGFALSKTGSNEVQFLSYEGSFTAADGAASGLEAIDIDVSETNSPLGYSLEYDETSMVWVVVTNATPGDFGQGALLALDAISKPDFKIFPNPTSIGYVNITSTTNDATLVTVFDVLGKQVLSKSITNKRLNVSALQSGIYIIKISQNNATITKKLVIK